MKSEIKKTLLISSGVVLGALIALGTTVLADKIEPVVQQEEQIRQPPVYVSTA